MNRHAVAYAVAAAVFLGEQISKWIVLGPLDLRTVGLIELLPFFDLRYTENHGISLGLFQATSDTMRWILVGATSLIAIGVAYWITREEKRWDQIALGLVLGGALGNILDRVRHGYVVDFADLYVRFIPESVCPSFENGRCHLFYIFNVADAAISIGVVILLLRAILVKDAPKENAEHA